MRKLWPVLVLLSFFVGVHSASYATPIFLEYPPPNHKLDLTFTEHDSYTLLRDSIHSSSTRASQVTAFPSSDNLESYSIQDVAGRDTLDAENEFFGNHSWVEVAQDLVTNYEILPEALINWKVQVDNFIYDKPIYYTGTKTKIPSKPNNDHYIEWRVFLDSIYFTWIKFITVTTVSIWLLIDCLKIRKKSRRYRKRRSVYQHNFK